MQWMWVLSAIAMQKILDTGLHFLLSCLYTEIYFCWKIMLNVQTLVDTQTILICRNSPSCVDRESWWNMTMACDSGGWLNMTYLWQTRHGDAINIAISLSTFHIASPAPRCAMARQNVMLRNRYKCTFYIRHHNERWCYFDYVVEIVIDIDQHQTLNKVIQSCELCIVKCKLISIFTFITALAR